MTPMRSVLLLAGLSVACGSHLNVPPSTPRAVDLGGNVTATLGDDGSLVVKRGDVVVLQTPPGVALFTRVADPERPDAWHDPVKPGDIAPTAIAASAVTMEAIDDPVTSMKAIHFKVSAQTADTALMMLSLAADDGFYTGLGERFDHVDARGRVVPMHIAVNGDFESGTNEAHVPVPLLVSSRGYGVFVASREAGAFDVATTDASLVRATFEGRELDVYIYVDPDPLAIVARFARQTGLPRPLPLWALSPMHWRNEWASDVAAIGDATELRRRHIPASCLWIDNPWQISYNDFRIDPKRFTDPPAMMAKLAALGLKVIGWTTPYLEVAHGAPANEAQMLEADAAAKGYFVKDATGKAFISPTAPVGEGGAPLVDFTNDAAKTFWIALVDRATTAGFSGYKVDYGEELLPALFNARLELRFADGTTGHTARTYPIAEHATYHASLDKTVPGNGILIVRASAYGGATQADIVWPGDLDSAFQKFGDAKPSGGKLVGGLPSAVVAAQTLATSGFPAFGSDTGGFRGEPTRESLLRWAEHTALSVVLQLGGGGDSHNPWMFDEEAATIYGGLARLHQRLVPYLAAMMAAATKDGTPTIRPLPLAFPSDVGSRARADDEYLLGPDLLAAPVVVAGVTSRDVHMPPGKWISWWDASIHEGPKDENVAAPLGQPPLFARAGAIVPMYPDGIDTLVDATEPGTVTLASRRAEAEARAWVMGAARTTFDDGAAIAIDDGAQGIGVAWTPGSARTMLTIDVDVRARMGATGAITMVDGAGSRVADEAAVRASTTSAWAIDAAGGRAWIRIVGAGSAKLR